MCWPPETLLSSLGGSVLGPRLSADASERRATAQKLLSAWPQGASQPPPSPEEFLQTFMRAESIVASRAIHTTSEAETIICPVVDLLNHTDAEYCNAKLAFEGGATSVRVAKRISPGSEVLICYDSEADFLDLWERYGFFDSTATIHTVEIEVAGDLVAPGPYWIPEAHVNVPLECPLLAKLRDALGTQLGEQKALEVMADLIRRHLARYPETASESAIPESSSGIQTQALGAKRVIEYEKQLLSCTLKKIEALVRG
eukprot:TRINITY_DN43027_c0_g1_i1.p1 TRINITY_DN43027_c0_g1~~TRINITY_DN43027_c0_g1_i1.p1  ORF type:complete len:257 (-),score=56.54 TRINITY_DN43027_c0_g1_i1:21-791(-)